MDTATGPVIEKITKHAGVAGQFTVTARVRYPDEEQPREVSFVGSTFGGPVVMVTEYNQIFVSAPGRFGTFGEAWVRRFFA